MSDAERKLQHLQAWYERQFSGVCHRLNEQASEIAQLTKRADAMSRLYDELVAEREKDKATIGKLMVRLDAASAEFAKLRKSVTGEKS